MSWKEKKEIEELLVRRAMDKAKRVLISGKKIKHNTVRIYFIGFSPSRESLMDGIRSAERGVQEFYGHYPLLLATVGPPSEQQTG